MPAHLFITCRLGMERVVASQIRELDSSAEVTPSPGDFQGLVLVSSSSNPEQLLGKILAEVVEVESAHLVEAACRASLDEIVSTALKLADRIKPGESFAVRTVRRGKHSFTSLDVNVAVGAALKERTGALVDLENPDKVLFIQILQDDAYLYVASGGELRRKMGPGKYPMYEVFRRLVVAHEPYLGPPEAAYTMGTRVGREVQVFEVGKLYVTPIGPVEAEPLYHFLRGLFEGARSRYEVQKRSYGRGVHLTQVYVQDMYQFVRSRLGKPLVICEPEGEPVSRVADELADFLLKSLKSGKEVALMVGAREGVPTGLFRYADYVVDFAPGIVVSTEFALSSALIAIATVIHEKLASELSEA
ncbi:MAG: SPOUT family RNA methylase [Thermofilum sp.]